MAALVLLGDTSSPALLSAIQAVAGSPAALAAAGALGLAAVKITYFSPLRDYDIREAPRELETVEPEAEVEGQGQGQGPLGNELTPGRRLTDLRIFSVLRCGETG